MAKVFSVLFLSIARIEASFSTPQRGPRRLSSIISNNWKRMMPPGFAETRAAAVIDHKKLGQPQLPHRFGTMSRSKRLRRPINVECGVQGLAAHEINKSAQWARYFPAARIIQVNSRQVPAPIAQQRDQLPVRNAHRLRSNGCKTAIIFTPGTTGIHASEGPFARENEAGSIEMTSSLRGQLYVQLELNHPKCCLAISYPY